MKLLWSLLMLLVAGRCHAIDNRDLYDVVAQGSVTLPRANEESLHVQLQTPIHFYTEKYDSIYVSVQICAPPECRARLNVKEKFDIFRQRTAKASYHSCLFVVRHHLKISDFVHHGSPFFTGDDDDKNRYQ